jgi:Ankyrin repeats (3 copies)
MYHFYSCLYDLLSVPMCQDSASAIQSPAQKLKEQAFVAAEDGDLDRFTRVYTQLVRTRWQLPESNVAPFEKNHSCDDLRDPYGRSLLSCAAAHDAEAIVSYLLTSCLNINIEEPDMIGGTPLIIASVNGSEKVVRLLLAHKADINACDKVCLLAFRFCGHVECVCCTNVLNSERYRETER